MEAVILARITELWKWRQWYRQRPDWGNFLRSANEHTIELRALVKLAREARRLERAQPDPITAALSYHDWQAAGPVTERELLTGYGVRP